MTSKQTIKSWIITILDTIIIGIGNIAAVIAMSYICTDFILGPMYNAILIVAAVSIINFLIWPLIRKYIMPFLIYTFGIGMIIITCLIFYGVCHFIPGVSGGIAAVIQVPLVMALVTGIISSLINLDLDKSHIVGLKKQAIKKKRKSKKYLGLIMLEIDGLSANTLKKAIEKGYMPTVKQWLDDKTHKLTPWETDLSSQTSSSQAGILHGNNKDIVAFRWVEKENNNKIMVSSKFSHAKAIEERISDGNGLLANNGASRINMFSGDTDNVIFTSSKLRDIRKLYNFSWYAVFSSFYTFQRILILFIYDMLVEIKSQIMHKIRNVQPRLKRGLVYIGARGGANVFLREVATETLIGDLLIGEIDSAYATYTGYDEIAHHSGVEDDDVWSVLRSIDMQFFRLQKAVDIGDRNYEFVILSDHGQGKGATFKQRYGISFPNFVRSLIPEDMTIFSAMDSNLDHLKEIYSAEGRLENIKDKMDKLKNEQITESKTYNTLKDKYDESKTINNIKTRYGESLDFILNQKDNIIKNKYEDVLQYIESHESLRYTVKKPEESELIVLGSGNLALIYFTQWSHRLTYEEIITLFPNIIPELVKHPGIGFILVDSKKHGPMVLGDEGVYYLDSDEIVGKNPIENFGKNVVKHLKRHNSFKHVPDILVNSFYDPETDEICAFEELIGSHGGLGGNQTKPFLIYPSQWEIPKEIIGGESIYKILKKEINKLKEDKNE